MSCKTHGFLVKRKKIYFFRQLLGSVYFGSTLHAMLVICSFQSTVCLEKRKKTKRKTGLFCFFSRFLYIPQLHVFVHIVCRSCTYRYISRSNNFWENKGLPCE
jgi:hypothetical protein